MREEGRKGRRRGGWRKDEEGRGEGRRKVRRRLHSRRRQQSIMRPVSAVAIKHENKKKSHHQL